MALQFILIIIIIICWNVEHTPLHYIDTAKGWALYIQSSLAPFHFLPLIPP